MPARLSAAATLTLAGNSVTACEAGPSKMTVRAVMRSMSGSSACVADVNGFRRRARTHNPGIAFTVVRALRAQSATTRTVPLREKPSVPSRLSAIVASEEGRNSLNVRQTSPSQYSQIVSSEALPGVAS